MTVAPTRLYPIAQRALIAATLGACIGATLGLTNGCFFENLVTASAVTFRECTHASKLGAAVGAISGAVSAATLPIFNGLINLGAEVTREAHFKRMAEDPTLTYIVD